MIEFIRPVSTVQLLIPAICTGMLIVGIHFSIYLAIRYKSLLYVTMSLIGVFAFVFVGSEMFILAIGGMSHNWKLSIHFHQSEQLAGVFFTAGLPFLIYQIINLGKICKRITLTLAGIGLLFSAICIAALLVNPDLFISSTIHKTTWLVNEADYGRGYEGPLYYIRDGMLTVFSFFALIALAVDYFRRRKEFTYLVFPLIGIVIAIVCGAIDSGFVYMGVNYDFFPHEYFSRFSIGVTLFVLSVMAGLTKQYIDVAKEVEYAHRLISVSEEKYRVLVEGTNDLIFTLDGGLNFITANNAALKELAYNMEELVLKNFMDIVHSENASNDVERQVFLDKISQFHQTRLPAAFRAFLRGDVREPKEYQLRFEFVDVHGKNEIIVKAAVIPENTLVRYLDSESQKYVIGNYLVAAEEVSKRLVANLAKFMTVGEITPLRIGLREIIINAIEHGNLNITFEEKTKVTFNANYLEFITSRQKDPRFRNRKVTIKFALNADRVIYVIEDEGEGFDCHKTFSRVRDIVTSQELAHGRGITMALGVFDSMRYNDRGNKVTLVKRFNRFTESNNEDDSQFI
jgi:PAS domain-containing protein